MSLFIRIGLLLALVFAARPVGAQDRGLFEHRPLLMPPVRPWLYVSGSYRLRYEHLLDPLEPKAADDGVLLHRLLALVEARRGIVIAGAELEDARAFGFDGDTPLGTSQADAAELLQAYAGIGLSDAILRVGRITMDIGSRRFVARNRFRNTINAFTGVDLRYGDPGAFGLAAFYVSPIERRPSGAALRDHEVEMDRADFSVTFWGMHVGIGGLPFRSELEAFVYRLTEEDADGRPTRNRRLWTPGVRLIRRPRIGGLDVEVEAALQRGRSRETASPDDHAVLDHRADFFHAGLGYTFGGRLSPRLALQYDAASGDARSHDGVQGRFDTLFGARRFEYGPTGIYGVLARANMRSPEIRLEFQPHRDVDGFVAYRVVWVDSKHDAFGGHEPAWRSGDGPAGRQIELRLRARVLSDVLEIETGFAYFDNERVGLSIESPDIARPLYAYASATVLLR